MKACHQIHVQSLRRQKIPSQHLLVKFNNGNTRVNCETCSKLPIKAPERRQGCRSGVFIVNSEHILHRLHSSLWTSKYWLGYHIHCVWGLSNKHWNKINSLPNDNDLLIYLTHWPTAFTVDFERVITAAHNDLWSRYDFMINYVRHLIMVINWSINSVTYLFKISNNHNSPGYLLNALCTCNLPPMARGHNNILGHWPVHFEKGI